MHKAVVVMNDGREHLRDIVEMTVTLDERIADGFYFARSLKLAKYLIEHPEEMEQTIGEELSEGAKAAIGQ